MAVVEPGAEVGVGGCIEADRADESGRVLGHRQAVDSLVPDTRSREDRASADRRRPATARRACDADGDEYAEDPKDDRLTPAPQIS